jgi:hypothetical protein
MTALITLNGHDVRAVTLRVGNVGPWVAEVELTDAPALTGPCTLTIGAASFVGAVVAVQAGAFVGSRKLRLVGGAGGWSRTLPALDYHNDAGVKAQLVAADAARQSGETLGTFAPAADRLGPDFVRSAELASGVLERVAGGVTWWVDYAGVTHVGPRPAVAVHAADYELLGYDPASRVVLLAADDVAKLPIGATITDARIEGAQTVRDLEYVVERDRPPRVIAWCGGDASSASRLATVLRAIVERCTDAPLYGVYRYRVVSQSGGRCDLQAVRKQAGLPDLQSITQWPGVAGVANQLSPGAEVIVQFIEGDHAQPILTHYAGVGVPGFSPVHITIGDEAGQPAARQGDPVSVSLPPAVFSGTIIMGGVPSPATGVLTFSLNETSGVITGGSGKVSIA